MDILKQIAVQTYTSITALLHNGLAVFGAIAAVALLMGARPVVDHVAQLIFLPDSLPLGTVIC